MKLGISMIIMETNLRVKCQKCGHWNKMQVEKVFLEQPTSEEKVRAYIPMYQPLKVARCKNCGNIIGEPTVLIRILRKAK